MRVIAFAIMFVCCSSVAKADDVSAAQLAAVCEYEAKPEELREKLQASCMSFIRGFFGYHDAMRSLNAVSGNAVMTQFFCLPPEGETLNAVRMRFVLEAKKHLDTPDMPAGFVLFSALTDAFPCP